MPCSLLRLRLIVAHLLSQTVPNHCIAWQGVHTDLALLEMKPDFLKSDFTLWATKLHVPSFLV